MCAFTCYMCHILCFCGPVSIFSSCSYLLIFSHTLLSLVVRVCDTWSRFGNMSSSLFCPLLLFFFFLIIMDTNFISFFFCLSKDPSQTYSLFGGHVQLLNNKHDYSPLHPWYRCVNCIIKPTSHTQLSIFSKSKVSQYRARQIELTSLEVGELNSAVRASKIGI